VQQQIAGNFKDGVAEKENPEEQTVLLAGDGQLFVHRQGREPDVDPVKKANYEKKEDKGKNLNPHFLDCSRLDGHGPSD
jgi:hypothetical protein